MTDPVYDSMKRRELQDKTYNDGLEAAALYLDNQAKYTEITDLNRAKMLSKKAAAIRALKE